MRCWSRPVLPVAVSFGSLYAVFLDSARSSASVGLVIGSALIFNYIVATENIPQSLAQLMAGLDLSPRGFLVFTKVLFLVLGCLLDATTIILVIIPLFLPTARALGIDLVHFGVVSVVNCMIGLITPPYGMLLFVVTAIFLDFRGGNHPGDLGISARPDRGARPADPRPRTVALLAPALRL